MSPGQRQLRVLTIDDDPVTQQMVAQVLMKIGVQLFVAGDVVSGIRTAHLVEPDVLLVDLSLPDGRGEMIIQRLKLEPALKDAKFIVITADTSDSTRKSLEQMGVDSYFVKPLDESTLTKAIKL